MRVESFNDVCKKVSCKKKSLLGNCCHLVFIFQNVSKTFHKKICSNLVCKQVPTESSLIDGYNAMRLSYLPVITNEVFVFSAYVYMRTFVDEKYAA